MAIDMQQRLQQQQQQAQQQQQQQQAQQQLLHQQQQQQLAGLSGQPPTFDPHGSLSQPPTVGGPQPGLGQQTNLAGQPGMNAIHGGANPGTQLDPRMMLLRQQQIQVAQQGRPRCLHGSSNTWHAARPAARAAAYPLASAAHCAYAAAAAAAEFSRRCAAEPCSEHG
jgi:hypothetical protein